jgi:hypothetical protein
MNNRILDFLGGCMFMTIFFFVISGVKDEERKKIEQKQLSDTPPYVPPIVRDIWLLYQWDKRELERKVAHGEVDFFQFANFVQYNCTDTGFFVKTITKIPDSVVVVNSPFWPYVNPYRQKRLKIAHYEQ